MSKKIIIVGTGLGGLASGLLLSKQGYKVEFVEKNKQAGGRLNQIKKDGFTFDTGPSFFSMSFVFKDFMDKCGVELPFKFVELDPLYSVNFSGDDKTYHLYKDIKKLSEQFADVEPDFEIKMEKYLKKSKRLFDDTFDIVIRNNFDNNFDYAKKLMGVNPVHVPQLFNTFFNHVKSHFSSKEARSIISLVAFFLGRTPFDTMAIYSLLSHTEFRHDGYYNVEGGMYNIINGLVSELEKAGAVFHYDSEVIKVEKEGEKITKVIDNNGKAYDGDVFLINSDAALFRGEVLHREKFSEAKLEKMEWTMGYLTFYVGIKGKLDKLNLHNYFLGSNFEEYGRDVMHKPDALEKPYYYVNNVSKYNPSCAPEGCESLFFVCPVPNLQYKKDWSDKDDIVNSIIKDFSQRIGVDIMPDIVTKTIYTPYDWEEQFNLFRGSGLGLSHQFTQIGALRPKNFDEEFKNLFYVGASTLPGAGLPMAVISAELATERILKALK
ncbi:MAG: phytoene desaturase [Bacteroidales bacterium]|nr:phytoene desaturase [Bacteroidales bacterium]